MIIIIYNNDSETNLVTMKVAFPYRLMADISPAAAEKRRSKRICALDSTLAVRGSCFDIENPRRLSKLWKLKRDTISYTTDEAIDA